MHYWITVRSLKLRLSKLQAENQKELENQKIRSKKRLEDADGVIYWENVIYVPKTIKIKVISRYHDDLLIGHFENKNA